MKILKDKTNSGSKKYYIFWRRNMKNFEQLFKITLFVVICTVVVLVFTKVAVASSIELVINLQHEWKKLIKQDIQSMSKKDNGKYGKHKEPGLLLQVK